ncbi:MAG: hypothetical protein ACI8UO_005656 [Verrucomicrobiales bacterium]|jgi:hypothetical protein
MMTSFHNNSALLRLCASLLLAGVAHADDAFFEQHCFECHDDVSAKGDLDLTSLSRDFADPRWIRIHDRIQSGEMPPAKKPRPAAADRDQTLTWLKNAIVAAEEPHPTPVRRLTRIEYENTLRDLFDLPGLLLRDQLPADGSAHGFDKNADALSISHVNMAKYMEAADYALDFAIATQPEPPSSHEHRLSLASQYYVRLLIANNGGAVYLKDKKPDPNFPPVIHGIQHVDQGAHERLGMFETDSAVGVFRHEDESFLPWTQGFAAIHPGRYRIKASLWSYTWDKGEVKPSRGVEAMRLSVKQLQGRGLGQDHPSYVIGYFDAPSLDAQEHEFEQWLNPGESIGFNVSSLAPVHIYHQYKRNLMSFTGPGIACDWIDIEGPIHDVWPPPSHLLLFGDLKMVEFDPKSEEATFPKRETPKQMMSGAKNQADPFPGHWTVQSEDVTADARRLLASFLPKLMRRPVEPRIVDAYVGQVENRLAAGDSFELAMRWAYRAALCSPQFLFHVEPDAKLDDFALANRLAYFLWNATPDERLTQLATTGEIRKPDVLRGEVERLLGDPKSQRFIEDFCGQWLRLREIAATDPDRNLYPEFSTYLQNSMVMETEAYFRELIDKDHDATHLIDSDFAMLNEKLALHYGIEGVSGSQIRRVELPQDSPRGGFLTQAAILKITANGTTTSPVPRGAFVMERLLGQPIPPPPPNVPAIEPDVRGATTIREQLDKHRADPSCASCHAKLDPPGFALESFDVIGGYRDRYRSVGEGDKAEPERHLLDPHLHVSFKLGPNVDPSYELPDGHEFTDIVQLQQLLTRNPDLLAANVAEHLAIYATARDLTFSDRDRIAAIVANAKPGGIRSLIHELIQSELFQSR